MVAKRNLLIPSDVYKVMSTAAGKYRNKKLAIPVVILQQNISFYGVCLSPLLSPPAKEHEKGEEKLHTNSAIKPGRIFV